MGSPMGKIKEHDFNAQMNKFIQATTDINESLNNIKNYMKPIDGTNDIWKGKTANSVVDQYKKYESDFDDINSKLKDFGSYLRTTYDNYENAMIKSQNTIEDTSDNYTVNG